MIASHYAQFRELGIDFLIMDDTNGVDNDGGRIKDNIRAWFDFMDAQPAEARIPICIGGGGEMRAEGRAGQERAANFYWEHLARRPSYFQLAGKPLLLVDTDKNYGPGDFEDGRARQPVMSPPQVRGRSAEVGAHPHQVSSCGLGDLGV